MEEKKNIISSKYIPTDADYEKAEMDQLRAALKCNYTERSERRKLYVQEVNVWHISENLY
jgi:hypothetical protein